MAPDVTIRRYRSTDREALARMAADVVAGGAEFVFESVDEVLGYWLGRRTLTFVAESAGERGLVVGSYAIKPNQPGRGSHVANLGYMVAASHRRRGIGKALGEHSLTTARELGFRSLQFNMVVATNVAAVRAWEAVGFRVVGTLPGVFRHREEGLVDALVMHRDL